MLSKLQQKYEIVGDFRGRGLMLAIELVTNRRNKTPATKETAEIFKRTRDHGLIVSKSGASRSILRMVPPMCLDFKDVEVASDAFEQCFAGY